MINISVEKSDEKNEQSIEIKSIEPIIEFINLKTKHIEQEISKKLWHQPSLWAAVFAVVISITSAVASLIQFDAESTLRSAKQAQEFYDRSVALEETNSKLNKSKNDLKAEQERLKNLKEDVLTQQQNLNVDLINRDKDIARLIGEKNLVEIEVQKLTNKLRVKDVAYGDLKSQLEQLANNPEIKDLTKQIESKNIELNQFSNDNKELKKRIEFYSIYIDLDLRRNIPNPFVLPGESLRIRLDNVTNIRKDVDFSYGLEGDLNFKVNSLSIGHAIAREIGGKIYIFKVLDASTENIETAKIRVTRVMGQTEI